MTSLIYQTNGGGTLTLQATNTASNPVLTLPALTGNVITSADTGTVTSTMLATELVFPGTGEITLPNGTTAQRSGSPTSGMIRFNTTYSQFEGYTGSAWGSIGGGATGGGSDQVFVQNGQSVTTNYTIPTGKNASSVGPISVNSGVTVSIPSGQKWVIL